MTEADNSELKGITLKVYLYIVNKGKPVGPREVMKVAHLSSPSVAYRHLQKLEDLGYLRKNLYGAYMIKGKAPIKGYIWIGQRIMPKMMFYSIVFICILIVELIVFVWHYPVENYVFKIFFLLLMLVTGSAMCVFIAEWLIQHKQITRGVQTE